MADFKEGAYVLQTQELEERRKKSLSLWSLRILTTIAANVYLRVPIRTSTFLLRDDAGPNFTDGPWLTLAIHDHHPNPGTRGPAHTVMPILTGPKYTGLE